MINAEFIVSAFSERDFPREGTPEVVLAGRSNVGKSSLINRLAGTKDLARTSSTPGKTRSINFYSFNRSFLVVDLPGFGYARTGIAERKKWKLLVEEYFRDRPTIALVLQLVDARMPPTDLDMELADWLNRLKLPRMVVATKADKLSGNKRLLQQRILADTLLEEPVIFASAVNGTGCKEILKRMTLAVQRI